MPTTMSHSHSSQAQPQQDHPPRSSSSSSSTMCSSATYARTNDSRIQTNAHPVVPHPNVDFLSKYQVTLPAKITDSDLPASFKPTNYDVVCGRGKGSYNRPGNRRFRAIVQQHMDEYQAPASTQLHKTMVLNRIMDLVQAQNKGTTRFVKRGTDGVFTVIPDDLAREKVGHAIRESIVAAEQNAGKNQLKEHPEWNKKHFDLLARQQFIFQNLVGSS